MRGDTPYIHAPEVDGSGFAPLSTPVHHASTVTFSSVEAFEERHERLYDGYSYGLYGTPTTRSLEQQVAALEGGKRALVTPSGLSAIGLVCMAFAQGGDKILMPSCLYGPARAMAARLLGPLGVETVVYEPLIGPEIAQLIDERTRLVWVESPGSVTFEVQDVPAIIAAAHPRGTLVAADNTWATPLLFNALAHGVDVSMQSLSKYASGHSDLNMGSVAVREERLFRRLKDVSRLLGLGVSGEDCFLCQRGLQTLPLRLRQSERTALSLLDWLAGQDVVARALHPSRPDHPGHGTWARDFSGSAGVFSIVLHDEVGRPALERAVRELRVFKLGASWGGAHSLLAPSDPRPGRSDLTWLPSGQVVRVSIGLEEAADLIEDLDRFLKVLRLHASTNASVPARRLSAVRG